MHQETLNIIRKAKRYISISDDFRAVRLLRKLVKEKKGESVPFELLAELYFNRREWKPAFYYAEMALPKSLRKNKMWNIYGVCASALGKSSQANKAWKELQLENVEFLERPIGLYYSDYKGNMLLNAQKIGPVHARILSIPVPGSFLNFGDVVLIDRKATSKAYSDGQIIKVHSFLAKLESSHSQTFSSIFYDCDQKDMDLLENMCENMGIFVDNWSSLNIQTLRSSTVIPSEFFDLRLNTELDAIQYIAFACRSKRKLSEVLSLWSNISQKSHSDLESH